LVGPPSEDLDQGSAIGLVVQNEACLAQGSEAIRDIGYWNVLIGESARTDERRVPDEAALVVGQQA